ncbi:hypothetical protein FKP32DRAFT_1348069 [Trametes sanguinea]|nr:hypothetical protein FKP32DRAFT_1348069 [Trametes sanguinea]
MSVPVKVLKACSYPGCEYISKSCSSATNEHNLGSHVSNFHAQKTKVWYGAVQITIFRDLKTKAFDCPCRAFTHIDASVVRRHAMKRHKGSADAQLAMENSLANRATTEEDVFLSPPPRQSASRDARKAPDIQRVSSAKTKAGTVLDSAALLQANQVSGASIQCSFKFPSRCVSEL